MLTEKSDGFDVKLALHSPARCWYCRNVSVRDVFTAQDVQWSAACPPSVCSSQSFTAPAGGSNSPSQPARGGPADFSATALGGATFGATGGGGAPGEPLVVDVLDGAFSADGAGPSRAGVGSLCGRGQPITVRRINDEHEVVARMPEG